MRKQRRVVISNLQTYIPRWELKRDRRKELIVGPLVSFNIGKQISTAMCGRSSPLRIFDNITRLVNGQHAREGAHPWIVALMKDDKHHCAGTIIRNFWVFFSI